MATKTPQQATLQFTPQQKKEVQAALDFLYDNTARGAEKWDSILAACLVGNNIDKALRGETAAMWRETNLTRKTAEKRKRDSNPAAILSPEEWESIKASISSDMSRGLKQAYVRKFGKPPASDGRKSNGKTPAKASKTPAAPGANGEPVPHAVVLADLLGKLQTRAKEIQGALVAFQGNVRIPAQGRTMIGDISESMVKLLEDLAAANAALA